MDQPTASLDEQELPTAVAAIRRQHVEALLVDMVKREAAGAAPATIVPSRRVPVRLPRPRGRFPSAGQDPTVAIPCSLQKHPQAAHVEDDVGQIAHAALSAGLQVVTARTTRGALAGRSGALGR